jgi:hypothetical protein
MTVVLDSPVKIFGGFVESASIGIGYGADSGTCQLSLVFEGDGPLRSDDKNSEFPNVGTAVAFKFGECVFGGIYQRYSHRKSIDGYRYDIIIESPGKWLEGIQIILNKFQGTRYTPTGSADNITNQIDNVWNPFAIRENFSYGGIFGGADVNSAGFPAIDALRLIEEISRGEHPFGGPAHFGDSYYEVDLSEVIRITPSYFRLKGDAVSLNSIIQSCCDIALHDYVAFIESKEVITESGVINTPVIKIKVIDKSFSPDSGYIESLVKQYEKQGVLVSADNGKEFPDIVTQRLVIGGSASRIAVNSNPIPPSIIPVWGKKQGLFGDTYLTGNGLDMNSSVRILMKATGSEYVTDVLEVRCAMSGFNTWILYHLLKNNTFPCATNVGLDEYQLNGLLNGTLTATQILDNTVKSANFFSQVYSGNNFLEFLQNIHKEIETAGNDFYGRKFLVLLPQEPGGIANNIKFVSEDYRTITSWEISDSAWSNTKPFADLNFYDGDGRLKSYATWSVDPRYDFSSLDSDWENSLFGIGTHRIEVERQIYWMNSNPYAVVTLPPINAFDDITTNQYGLFHLCKIIKNQTPNLSIMSSFGAENGPLSYAIAPRRIGPKTVGIAQESSRYTWGPWWYYSDKRGKAEVLVEESLKPETFGSASLTDTIGFVYANTSNATINSVETGYVELAEIPKYNVATKFAEAGPYVTGMDINMSIDGIKTTYRFNTWTPEFGKLAKYQAERIANINKSRIGFLQNLRQRVTKASLPPKQVLEGKFGFQFPLAMAGMSAMNGTFSNIVNINNKPALNMVAGDITKALAPMSQNLSNSYGASQEQFFSAVKVLKEGVTYKSSSSKPLPGNNELNPYFPPTEGKYTHSSPKTDFQIAVFDAKKSFDLQRPDNGEIKEVRTTAVFRNPMIVSGWGYDLTDKAVPEGESRDKFDSEAATNRSKWKTGPLSLMWDEEREVWAGGHAILEGVLNSNITKPISPNSPTTFNVKIYKKSFTENIWSYHEEILLCYNRDPSLEVVNKPGKIYVMVTRINYEWRPIWIGCPGLIN